MDGWWTVFKKRMKKGKERKGGRKNVFKFQAIQKKKKEDK